MNFDEARKTLAKAEKHLGKIRATRAELEQAESDAQSRLEAAQADRQAALQAGKTQDLAKHGQILENARISLQAATDDLGAITQAEHGALGDLVLAEKACQESLREAWDQLADQARAELVAIAGPALRRYWQARYNGSSPLPLGECLRSHAVQLREEIDTSAEASPDHEFGLPEAIESALLSHSDRSKFTRHPQG